MEINKKEFLQKLVSDKHDLIALKKSITKSCDPISFSLENKITTKVITNDSNDDPANGIIYRTVIGNTYGWMDSHDDVHIPGIFSKSISENKTNLHLHDHLFLLTAKVGNPIKVYEQNVPWTSLGVNKAGSTTCLAMDSEIRKSFNEMIFDMYLKGEINQHSVGMMYVKLFMCVNDSDFKEEYANWNNYIGYVANKSKAEEKGYFWAVTEAKLKEISCVISGSNELTPTSPITVAGKSTTEINEPLKNTQSKTNPINYNYLLKNI